MWWGKAGSSVGLEMEGADEAQDRDSAAQGCILPWLLACPLAVSQFSCYKMEIITLVIFKAHSTDNPNRNQDNFLDL